MILANTQTSEWLKFDWINDYVNINWSSIYPVVNNINANFSIFSSFVFLWWSVNPFFALQNWSSNRNLVAYVSSSWIRIDRGIWTNVWDTNIIFFDTSFAFWQKYNVLINIIWNNTSNRECYVNGVLITSKTIIGNNWWFLSTATTFTIWSFSFTWIPTFSVFNWYILQTLFFNTICDGSQALYLNEYSWKRIPSWLYNNVLYSANFKEWSWFVLEDVSWNNQNWSLINYALSDVSIWTTNSWLYQDGQPFDGLKKSIFSCNNWILSA